MKSQDRLHALDSVRAFALLLGIVLHATMSFLPGFKEQGWPIVDNSPSWAAATIFFVIHVFRMTLFFVIAGFFARLVFHRRGAGAFAKDRAKRIGAPLVVGWVVFGGLMAVTFVWAIYKNNGGTMPTQAGANIPAGGEGGFQLTHLWFLYYLLVMYVVLIPVRGVIASLDSTGAVRQRIDKLFAVASKNPLAPILLGAPIAAVFCTLPKWVPWMGIPTPDFSLVPQLAAMVGFGGAFVFGWLLQRQPDLLRIWEGRWSLNMAIAIALTSVCLYLRGFESVFAVIAPGSELPYAICYATAIWYWVFGIIGVGMKFYGDESPVRRYVADSSYWLYIAHLPLVFALQVWVMQWPIHWAVKFAFIVVATYALLFLTYHYLVRSTYLGEVLNGRKYPRGPFFVRHPFAAVAGESTSTLVSMPRTEGALATLSSVKKNYGAIAALDGLNLEVRPGELLAVLGPNGAGKSTAIAIMMGLQEATSGAVTLMGRSPSDLDARRQVGIMMQEVQLPPELTVREHIDLTTRYYPAPYTADEAIKLTRIHDLADRPYRKLSGGQKRQVQFAMAICGKPKLLFLDEPTVGLDISAREAMWATIRELIQSGCSIVLTTHYLEEAEALANRVVVINKGRMIASGSVAELRAFVSRRQVSCVTSTVSDIVRTWEHVTGANSNEGRLSITTTHAEAVVRRLLLEDAALSELEVRRAGLTEVFTELTQEGVK